jgi:hypothetical protein
MAICGSCGKEMQDNNWTCGSCGAPVLGTSAVAGANTSFGGSATSYETPPAAYGGAEAHGAPAVYGAPAAPAARSGLSRAAIIVILAAVLAVVAIIAVWFFVVRGTGGTSPFLGTWNEPGNGTATIEITLKSGDFKVTMTGKDAAGAEKSYTIPAHLEGSDLVITVDDFVKATGNEEKAAQAKAIFETLIKDFRLVFTLNDPAHLNMEVEGTPVGGSATTQVSKSSTVLVKDD